MSRRSRSATVMRGGFLSIISVVIILALAVLAVLELSTARAMAALSAREAAMTSEAYEAEAAAQQVLARMDAALAPVRAAGGDAAEAAAALDALARGGELQQYAPADGTLECAVDAEASAADILVTTKHGRTLSARVALGSGLELGIEAWRLTSAPTSNADDFVLYTSETRR